MKISICSAKLQQNRIISKKNRMKADRKGRANTEEMDDKYSLGMMKQDSREFGWFMI